MKRARRGNLGARFPAARPVFMQPGFSVAFVPDRCPLACWVPARAAVHRLPRVRVLSPAVFHSGAEPHFVFHSWAGRRSAVSQTDAGDRYPHSPVPAEQISPGAVVAPVAPVVAPIAAAVGRARLAVCSVLPERGE
jgi:hypothetical protein